MKTCPECLSEDVAEEASRCPHCRHVFKGSKLHQRRSRVIIAAIVLVIGGFFAYRIHDTIHKADHQACVQYQDPATCH